MKILIPTLYGNTRGGSVKILLASANILKKKHMVNVRANIDEANQLTKYALSDIIDTKIEKIITIFKLVKIIVSELMSLRNQKIDIIYVHDELALYTYGIIGKIINCKIVWHIHAKEGNNLQWALRNWLSDYKIYISHHTKKRTARNSFVLYNPILFNDPLGIEPQQDSDVINVSIIGSISDNKNQFYGIEIVKKLVERGTSTKSIILNIFGECSDVNYYNKLITYIENNNLDKNVKFYGYSNKERIYSNTDIVLCTSKYESFGLVLIEAISRGIPVIASKTDAVDEICNLLCYDKKMIFQNIEEACESLDFALITDVGSYIDKVKTIFSYEEFSNRLLSIFMEIEKNED